MKKKTIVSLLKLAVSLGIIAYLFWNLYSDPERSKTLDQLRTEPKEWSLLFAAWALTFSSAVLTFIRWYFLVRALDLPFRIRDSLRLGFLGYMFNFVSLGAVGGDLFKAVLLARDHPGRRAEAVSTILVDRLLGLYGLLLVGSAAVASGTLGKHTPAIDRLCTITLVITAVLTVLFVGVMLPRRFYGPLPKFLDRLPKVAHMARDLVRAARLYRQRHGVIWAMLGLTFVVHFCNILSFYCIARGLPGAHPSLAMHFLIVPLGILSAAIPLPFAALGAFEWIMRDLYASVNPPGADPNLGLVVAVVYRIASLLVAPVGVLFYLGERREMREAMHEAEVLEDTPDADLSDDGTTPAELGHS